MSDAIWVLKSLLAAQGTYQATAELLGVNKALVWKAINRGYVSPGLLRALANNSPFIDKPEPKDPRARVWMRTDNAPAAVRTLLVHYPELAKIAPALLDVADER